MISFHWLDHGEGANLSLPKCSREKLEAEQILCVTEVQLEHALTHYLGTCPAINGNTTW